VDQLPHMLAALEMFGHQALLPIPDVDRSTYFLCVGGNPLVSNGSIMTAPGIERRLEGVRARGGKLVVVDPRRTETARAADEHHFIRPGTDALLLMAMVRTIFEEKLAAPGRLARFLRGLGELEKAAEPFAPERVAVQTGIAAAEIRRLAREGRAASEIALTSPVGGTVIERGVVEGQYVGPDTPLLTVADLSHVWVMADYYEMDVGRVRVGDVARFTSDGLGGRVFEGRVDFVYPTVSSQTRTLRARVDLANPDGVLRPGMFGRVRVVGRAAPTLSVPSEAVVNTGDHAYVFLAHAGGDFEPRLVWTGMPEGDRVQILKGVAEGDTVVASASFLIDSESRLEAAIAGMSGASGMEDVPGMTHGAGR
ncbi:MAG TPA: efflux RND transporter periplasmic adaptor subunit, partial [Dongiaceae bacterium]|nr:efflux RND transporter periplasmic adaptor subunit [Dongiaceae bacterium]